jgi:ABC-2 type transport system ATP-binding protein
MTPLLAIQQVSKHYASKTVLDQINLDIYRGEIIGYIGPNGAGKSTTVKVLTGIIQDYEGTVYYDGQDIREHLADLKQKLGYVPELAELYEMLTPKEYLYFIGKLHHMEDALIEERMLNMMASFDMTPHLNERMDSFSKGMRQKVLLVSGLLHNPEIIFLDEPLSGLDANAVLLVKELLQVLKQQGKTIFYCSHMMDVVEKVSDRIVLINNGQLIANGTMQELRAHENESLETIFARLTNASNPALQMRSFTN